MKGLFRHTWIKLLAVALSLSLTAAAAALVLGGTGPLQGVGERVSRPFSRLFSTASAKFHDLLDYGKGMKSLRAENQALEEELAQARQAARQGDLAAAENARLRALLDLPRQGQDLTFTAAWVIARTPDNWRGEVTIDQGTAQGVQAGQCVVDSQGALVGRVKEAGKTWASLTLVTDPAFRLAGQGTKSGALGALEGDPARREKGELALTCLTQAQPAKLGEEVVTFAQGTGYPSGLLVGTVLSEGADPGGLTRSAAVTPAADLDALGQVFVITAFREVR